MFGLLLQDTVACSEGMDNATLRRRGSQSFDDLLLSTQAFLINEPRAAAPSISSLSSAQV